MALTSEQEGLCARALKMFGKVKQWRHVQEECCELSAVINKRFRERASDDQLLDEVADVIIMSEQARQMAGAARVDRMVEKKLARLKARMDAYDAGEKRFSTVFPWQLEDDPR